MSLFFGLCSFKNQTVVQGDPLDNLRKLYSSGDQKKWPEPNLDPRLDMSKFEDIGHLPKMKFPADNPYTAEKANLGKLLFFDPRLSSSGQIACVSCHNPELAWTDNLTRSFGHNRQNGGRNAMTILNSGYSTSLFWDGRASSLEDQSKFPIQDKLEMHESLDIAVGKINSIKGYKILFQEVFGSEDVTLDKIQAAIATFERTIKSGPTKFDRFIAGESEAYTNQELVGLHLFRTKARCINCHNTGYFSDNQFHNDGQTLWGTRDEDFGHYNVTNDKNDIGKFRTPTLREVARTGPWMHHGHFPSLIDVVQYYNLGNPAPIQDKYLGTERDSLIPKPSRSQILRRLDLQKDEEAALVAFLNTLSSSTQRMRMPELPTN